MTYSFSELMTLLVSDPQTFFQVLKAKAGVMFSALINLISLHKQELIWIVPSVFAVFIVLLVVIRLIRKKPSGETETVAEPEIEVKPAGPEAFKEPVLLQDEPSAPKKTPADETPAPDEIKEKTPESEKPSGLLKNIRSGLSKTRKALSTSVDKLFLGGGGLDDDMLEELEELLITSDVGVKTSIRIIENISKRSSEISSPDQLKQVMKDEIFNLVNVTENTTTVWKEKPHVMMVVGVNGVGKTTTIGKLATRFVKEGKKVLIVAADTFRAAASDQLAVWAQRSGADIVRHKDNSDPAAVAFDGIEAAVSRGVDIVIIDTAGRLHTKKNLMEELKKIERTVSGKLPGAPHETLMVVDATTGQNALQQAQLFNEAIGITNIALTKLDGTAKGGIVIGITSTLNIGLKYIGVGEQAEDLQDFDPQEFADAIM